MPPVSGSIVECAGVGRLSRRCWIADICSVIGVVVSGSFRGSLFVLFVGRIRLGRYRFASISRTGMSRWLCSFVRFDM